MSGTAQIIHGNALELPLPDNSVDLICTSPPYWSLRAYTDNGAAYDDQLGSEATWQEFLDNLIAATREMVRVLKPTGSAFVDLGDKFGPNKSLHLLPERYRIRCVDELGLIARSVIVWSKPNGLPESVTDRVRRSHEDWVHFTLSPRYFSAVDEIREAHSERQRPGVLTWEQRRGRDDQAARYSDQNGHGGTAGMAQSALGKLPGSVWTVPTEPLRVPDHLGVDHFAAFPTEWPRRIIAGWSPAGVCTACGEGRRPVARRDDIDPRHLASNSRQEDHERLSVRGVSASSILRTGLQSGQAPATHITGYACACREPTADTTPAVVLDPFGGTGTTALVAKALGRHGITVDMSADYCRLAQWRVNDPGELAKAARVAKPAAQVTGQESLLDLLGGEGA